jgi:hypothetical protein
VLAGNSARITCNGAMTNMILAAMGDGKVVSPCTVTKCTPP